MLVFYQKEKSVRRIQTLNQKHLMLVYIFHPKGIFKIAEINCLAEVLDSLCYEESLHTYVYAHTHTYIRGRIHPTYTTYWKPHSLSCLGLIRCYLGLNSPYFDSVYLTMHLFFSSLNNKLGQCIMKQHAERMSLQDSGTQMLPSNCRLDIDVLCFRCYRPSNLQEQFRWSVIKP